MTKEEVIDRLIEAKKGYTVYLTDEVIDIVIKTLEQKPCDDAISRQAVLDEMYTRKAAGDAITAGFIKNLQPVAPQSKIGRWIKHDTGHSIYYECSLCHCIAPCTETADSVIWKFSNYCPDCGAKMEHD